MILLITSSPRASECAAALQAACAENVECVESARKALSRLRTHEYTALIIDQNFMDPDPLTSDTMVSHVGTAVPVYVNFALSGVDRMVREVQAALRRREAEQLTAMRTAAVALRNELKSAVTGILLSSELALSVPQLPDAAEVKIRFVHELAQGLRRQLDAEPMKA